MTDAQTPAIEDSAAAGESVPLIAPQRLTQLAFVLILALVIARATTLELVRDPFEVSPGQAYTPLGSGPGTTVVLNLLCLLPAALVLLRRVVQPEYRLARVWSAWAWMGLGVLAVLSWFWASDKYSAAILGGTLLAGGAMAWAASQVVRSWGRLRVVAAVAVGLLAVYVAQGVYYRYSELPLLQDQIERSKDRILQERGFTPGTFASEQFLRRISGGEMIGFGSSPNTYAAMLVLLGVVSGGVLVQGLRDRREGVLLLPTVLTLVAGVWILTFTRSTTAFTTPLIAATVGGVAWLLGKRLIELRGTFFVLGVGLFVLGLVAVVAHGVYHGSLPGASMNFRWRYWTGSLALFLEHTATGVGFGNFGPWYLAHRLPAAAEEIRDPHNLLVRFATELGIVGLSMCLVWLLVSAWELTRPTRALRARGLAVGVIALAGVVALGTLINVAVSIDVQAGSDWVILELFKRLMFAGVLLVVAALALVVSRTDARADDTPAPVILLAMGCGLLVFLIHNLIDFSFFETGPMMVAAMLVGSVIGVRSIPAEAASKVGRTAAAAGLAATVLVAAVYGLIVGRPVIQGESLARSADELLRTAIRSEREGGGVWTERVQQAALTYKAAYDTVPWNSEYAVKSARAWLVARMSLPTIREMLDTAIRTDPVAVKARLDRARLEMQLPASAADLPTALKQLETATRLNPNDVAIRLEYADVLERLGRSSEAAEQIGRALAFDDLLDPTEPKRLAPEARREVEAKRLKLSPTTAPR